MSAEALGRNTRYVDIKYRIQSIIKLEVGYVIVLDSFQEGLISR